MVVVAVAGLSGLRPTLTLDTRCNSAYITHPYGPPARQLPTNYRHLTHSPSPPLPFPKCTVVRGKDADWPAR